MGVCSGRPPQLFSHQGISEIYGDETPGLPKPSLALLVCRVFLLLETHFKRILLFAEARIGLKLPSFPQQETMPTGIRGIRELQLSHQHHKTIL